MSKYLIGLTGNIATGKSTVAKMLQELGATVIDADALVHELQRKGTPTFDAIVAAFGSGILDRSGEIDRKALGAIVFADPAQLRVLEGILHPAVLIESMKRISEAPTPVVVYEAIKLDRSRSGGDVQCVMGRHGLVRSATRTPDARSRDERERGPPAHRRSASAERKNPACHRRHRQQRHAVRDAPTGGIRPPEH